MPPATYNRRRRRELPLPRTETNSIGMQNDILSTLLQNNPENEDGNAEEVVEPVLAEVDPVNSDHEEMDEEMQMIITEEDSSSTEFLALSTVEASVEGSVEEPEEHKSDAVLTRRISDSNRGDLDNFLTKTTKKTTPRKITIQSRQPPYQAKKCDKTNHAIFFWTKSLVLPHI